MSNERFQALAPWYANGSISAQDRAWVDAHLERHPEDRSELDWYRSLQSQLKASAPTVPATLGLARVLQRIQQQRPSPLARMAGLLAGLGRRPFAMAALALVVVQAGVIIHLLGGTREDAAQVRALQAARVTEGPMLKISFAPDAREADIRLLMIQIQGELAGGPGQLGDYYLRVPAGSEAAALARVQDDPIVQAASLAPGVPPRE